MAPRDATSSAAQFDLTQFLWGDLPLVQGGPTAGIEASASRPSLPPSPTQPTLSIPPDVSLRTGDIVLQESATQWDASSLAGHATDQRNWSGSADNLLDSDPNDSGSPAADDQEIDLDVLAAMAGLVDLDEDVYESALDDDDPFSIVERKLTYGELTERLQQEVLPRLRKYVEDKGYLTLGHLARSVVDLQNSEPHLLQVRALIEGTSVSVLPARSHHGVRNVPYWAIRQARERFRDLLHGEIDEGTVARRFGYAEVSLNEGSRSFLVQAWMNHCLSRAEEQASATRVTEEASRVGEDFANWSSEALAARDALILDNLSMVARMASSYAGKGLETDDLLQIGALGLFRAVVKYDPDRCPRFVNFASYWVYQSITRHIADHSRHIRLPVHVQAHAATIEEAVAQLWQTQEREPTLREVAAASGATETAVRAYLVTTRTRSLDASDHAQRVAETIPDPVDHLERVEFEVLTDAVERALASISPRERGVIEQRFGLLDGNIHTLQEIGREYGVTRERIRQIEDKALRRLRHPSRSKYLKEFVDGNHVKLVVELPAADVMALVPEFSPTDQEIIRSLWGLDGRAARSVRTTARRLGVPTTRVQQVSDWVIALHRTRPKRNERLHCDTRVQPREAEGLRSATGLVHIHPHWKLSAEDKTSADWAARRFGLPKPHGVTGDAPRYGVEDRHAGT
jgi:RNA polymerase primary sigma factor